jgi:cysteine desulfuration protein SufE
LSPIPARSADNPEQIEQVHECMTPVLIEVEKTDGSLYFYFDVPKESPTVRGFASILQFGLNGLQPEVILQIPNDFYLKLGLEAVLTHQRLNGFAAILTHMKRLTAEKLAD